MIQSHPEVSDSGEFKGFNEARRIMWCYEARARVSERFEETSFLADANVAAVHVDNTTRADRVFLVAFDEAGRQVGVDTLYVDGPNQHLDVASEFDHDFTGMNVVLDSQLDQAISRENGWVVDLKVLREYEPLADRRATQRAVFLVHLQDMMKNGEVRGFLFGRGESDEADAA
ncbi:MULTISPECIES: hypothetical protein [Streptomyces]|uniref:hypothetical protein n=1 Tax=Streptomyces TaxID=1883 RepID=UPI001675FE8E|nr:MULTISPECIES: hypothetical protein [Streptomyces]MBD3578809.1 hypothetical protein [Streptomyces sp. KD18]GGS80499.1 hypothetical protein GCM10010286_01270 [Streptomyces toxytricini]